ncbi:hypothetical protein [Pseudomonas oryzae]|uniref:MSHA biogenesis protein MshJ n=1 Tax=Pseudomonas oryzae TaxID=1392877 RepID=A0A1H1WIT9_9PSED|nr:hypothetical protein [Pseudomonas oryzae]SDS97015.1 MSHA biogenesis protein MshJ [Pseudomonas oryzae]
MNALLQRWQALGPREQWLAVLVALLLPGMAWLALGHEPLSQRVSQLDSARQAAQARTLEARTAQAELLARAAVDPDLAVRQALLAAQALREQQLAELAAGTAALIDPPRMQRVLQDLLQQRPGLHLLGLESFSAPLELPGAAPAEAKIGSTPAVAAAPLLYRHGMRVTLEGSYFELRDYLRGIEQQSQVVGGRRLFWERLDYQVGEAGPGKARITIELYTLSREAGWVGV